MNSLYFDCFAGVSGDMCLASLISLGVPETHLRSELSKLGIDDEFDLKVSKSHKQGIHGLRVDVELTERSHHSHGNEHDHGDSRNYTAIKEIIGQSALSATVKARAVKIFDEIAQAEAHIHQMPVESVHFHEVGATDSIVDIVGAAIGLEYLIVEKNVGQILCSPLELGSGKVKCAHGTYPVPAPATAQIVTDIPVAQGGVKGEATTPTGAAIMKACADKFVTQLEGTPINTVYGIGHRDADIPNVIRAQLLKSPNCEPTSHVKIEANIDDMSPEAFAPLTERLFDAGANDVFLQPIMMKKSRPAQMVSVLCRKDIANALGAVILNHSSTIGLRIVPFAKMVLPRQIVNVPTSLGEISAKVVLQPNGGHRFKSEHDEIMRLSKENGEPYLSLKRKIDAEIESFLVTHDLAFDQ